MNGPGRILWPSFLVSAAAVGIFFTLFDPAELRPFGEPAAVGRLAGYTIGFFFFWLLGAASSALTCLLSRTSDEINR